jgi:3-oxoacyl-[acyl-carrier-protein] synthase III
MKTPYRFENVAIAGLAHVDAPHRIASRDLSARLASTMARLGLREDMLESLSGIRARRWWDEGVEPSQVATRAGVAALAAAGVPRDRVGVLVSTSVCRDFIEPSVASLVHRNLELSPRCLTLDLANACLAFLDGMSLIGNMIERGQIDYGLVVDGESSRYPVECTLARLLDPACDKQTFRDNFATLTLGSGAVAMVLGHRDLVPGGHAFKGGVFRAATEYNHLCRGQREGMLTDAHTLLLAGLQLAQETWQQAGDQLGWRESDLSLFAIHQVSKVHTEKLCELLGIPPEKVPTIFEEHGNIGPASLPTTLAKAAEAGRLKAGDRVGLLGIGSGLNCGMMEVVW